MDAVDVFLGLVTIASFMYAVWTNITSRQKKSNYVKMASSINEMTNAVIWESNRVPFQDQTGRLRQYDQMLGYIRSINILVGQYSEKSSYAIHDEGLAELLEKEVLWTISMVYELERSQNVPEIWIYSPDLRPDGYDQRVGHIVRQNIESGKRYTYYYPSSFGGEKNLRETLLSNINPGEKWKESLKTIEIPNSLFSYEGNIVVYFRDHERKMLPYCFQEVILTELKERGVFWQKSSDDKARLMLEKLSSNNTTENVSNKPHNYDT